MRITSKRIHINSGKNIISNWKSSEEFYESYVIDSITEYKVSLRVPFNVKGTTGHMLIAGNIHFLNTEPTTVLVLNCNMTKINIYSVIIGGALGAIAFVGMNLSICVVASIFGSLIAFLILRSKVKNTGEKFLSTLITNNSE